MTTNQTIDGVPRELIERVTKPLTLHDDLADRIKARDELRALLDAPASDPDCIHCCGGGRDPFGAVCGCAAPKPAAQPKGVPVAYRCRHSANEPWFFSDKPGYWEWQALYTERTEEQ